MKDDRELIKTMLVSSFNARLDERVERSLRSRVHNIIPYHHFSNASSESVDLFINGHPYGCISLCQSIVESLSKFICSMNRMRVGKDFNLRVGKLAKAKIITSQAKGAFETIWGNDRNTFHHLNDDVPTDHLILLKRAEECLNALYLVESEVFAFKLANNGIVPLKPIYWPTPVDGKIPIFLKSNLFP